MGQREVEQHNLLALVLLGLPTLLAFCARSVGRDGALELGRLSNTLALLTFLRLIMNGRAMFGVIVGQALLLARGLCEVARRLARVGL